MAVAAVAHVAGRPAGRMARLAGGCERLITHTFVVPLGYQAAAAFVRSAPLTRLRPDRLES